MMARPLTPFQASCVDHWGYDVRDSSEKARLVWPLRFKPFVTFLLVATFLALRMPAGLLMAGLLGLLGTLIPSVSWIDRLYNHGVRRLFGAPYLAPDPDPRKFACGTADLFVTAGALAFLAGQPMLAYVLEGAVLLIAGIVIVSGYCVAAALYVSVARRLANRPAQS